MPITVYRSTDDSAPSLSGVAGSLISVLDACLVNGYGTQSAAGWTKAYSGTNLAAYRMSTVSPATGMYLRIDDTGTNTARCSGYQTMSDINTGTGQFPSETQVSGGAYVVKNAGTIVNRPWMIIASDRFFYFFAYANSTVFGTTTSADGMMVFGDIKSYILNDTSNCIIYGLDTNPVLAHSGKFTRVGSTYSTIHSMWIAKSYTGENSRQIVKIRVGPPSSGTTGQIGYSTTGAYPDPVTGELNLFTIEILENDVQGVRGQFPGLYDPYGGTTVGARFDTINGTGSLSGKEFILHPVWFASTTSSSTEYRAAIQISGDWYS
jgi:hypothetical protein